MLQLASKSKAYITLPQTTTASQVKTRSAVFVFINHTQTALNV